MAERSECDLVMKGGVTSGLVYQGAVLWLKDHYRFRSIGGASAGAIAAALTAAAEYGRKSGVDGFEQMRERTEQLGAEQGLLRSLFQPVPAARAAFEALLQLVAGHGSTPARVLRTLAPVLLQYWGLLAWAAAAVAAYVIAVALTGAASLGVLIASSVVLAFVALIAVVALAVGAAAWNLNRALAACAGRTPSDAPLTFADLEEREVVLRTITTDLAYGRPVDLPVAEDFPTEYLFDPDDLRQRVPVEVVRFLDDDRISPARRVRLRDGTHRTLRRLPRGNLPILLAVRLSSSFPLLLSTVRLWSIHPHDKQPMEHCFSDGGISSNFPIHFFDAWVPRRPTFGLDLQTLQSASETKISLPRSHRSAPPPVARYFRVSSLLDFAKQAADAGRNWHDAAQSELLGFRDRVCHIRLSRKEGGLNLDMDLETIRLLMERGAQAGRTIEQEFRWDWHRFVRYLTLMQVVQRSFRRSREGFDAFEPTLSAGGLPAETGYGRGHQDGWCSDAAKVTHRLIETAEGWGVATPPAAGFDQGAGAEPEPTPALRLVPDV